MKAIETMARIDEHGQLMLDQALQEAKPQQVRVIILMSEDELDADETPTEVAIAGIREGLVEALAGKTMPLSELWDGIDVD